MNNPPKSKSQLEREKSAINLEITELEKKITEEQLFVQKRMTVENNPRDSEKLDEMQKRFNFLKHQLRLIEKEIKNTK